MEILNDFKLVLIKLFSLLLLSPLIGYTILVLIERIEKAWKSGDRKQKWLALTLTSLVTAIILGWLQ